MSVHVHVCVCVYGPLRLAIQPKLGSLLLGPEEKSNFTGHWGKQLTHFLTYVDYQVARRHARRCSR